ncbi:MAG: undecaprenyl-diphosphate phosphatase [candidate division WOR-3 bacterium]
MVVEKIILGIVQGITEFLPVSSSGHLVFLKHIFGLEFKGAFYETFLHTATFLSVVFVLRDKIFNPQNFRKYFPLSVVATIPLIPTAFIIKPLEDTFNNPKILAFTFLITGVFLFLTLFAPEGNEKPNLKNSIIMGIFQTMALLPGISRSGITISSGIFSKMEPEEAFNLSFWIFLPASLGAFVLESRYIKEISLNIYDFIVWIITFLVGVISLKILRRVLLGKFFWVFSVYTLFLSILSFLIFNLRIITP